MIVCMLSKMSHQKYVKVISKRLHARYNEFLLQDNYAYYSFNCILGIHFDTQNSISRLNNEIFQVLTYQEHLMQLKKYSQLHSISSLVLQFCLQGY